MTPLWIEFKRDQKGNWYYKFNEAIIYLNELDKLKAKLKILLNHIHYACKSDDVQFNNNVYEVFDAHFEDYQKSRETLSYIKEDRERYEGFKIKKGGVYY